VIVAGASLVRGVHPCSKRLGIKTVAIYSEADSHSLHVKSADEVRRDVLLMRKSWQADRLACAAAPAGCVIAVVLYMLRVERRCRGGRGSRGVVCHTLSLLGVGGCRVRRTVSGRRRPPRAT
jgi:hypothetical protein